MSYIDGYVMPVKKDKKEEYLRLARTSAEVFKDHGALAVVENWADDVPEGKLTSLPMAVKCDESEIVVFSWIVWPSKAAREAGNKAAMKDKRFSDWDMSTMPFNGKRMIFGGFQTILEM
ncbi:DUF1428 domain-containing protein [Agaribacter flavus]|uniref:DUF1428 domain-containing protein n=1 Tax=Agaribacter flavus TaxID=1902781 RepID=A0ABV7FKN3_9ALTE